MPKYACVVKLTEEDGNSFAIMARVTKALRRAGASKEDIADYTREATSGNYDHLLQVTMLWVNTI
jgi:hypothetical protein